MIVKDNTASPSVQLFIGWMVSPCHTDLFCKSLTSNYASINYEFLNELPLTFFSSFPKHMYCLDSKLERLLIPRVLISWVENRLRDQDNCCIHLSSYSLKRQRKFYDDGSILEAFILNCPLHIYFTKITKAWRFKRNPNGRGNRFNRY